MHEESAIDLEALMKAKLDAQINAMLTQNFQRILDSVIETLSSDDFRWEEDETCAFIMKSKLQRLLKLPFNTTNDQLPSSINIKSERTGKIMIWVRDWSVKLKAVYKPGASTINSLLTWRIVVL